MDDKEFGDHLASNPKGDSRNVHQGSISDAREAREEYIEEHGDEEIGMDCCICGDTLHNGKNTKIRDEDLPEEAEPQGDDGGWICANEEGSCLGKLRRSEI